MIPKRRREIPQEINLQRFTQRVIQKERPIYWEVTVTVIMRGEKKDHMNMSGSAWFPKELIESPHLIPSDGLWGW